jgi:OOP family OmpA-OmpF porin
MRMHWWFGVACATAMATGAGMMLPDAAHAQATPPFDAAIDVQTFEYAIGPKTFITIADSEVTVRGQLAVDALVTFLTKPFKIYDVDKAHPDVITGTRTTVVSSMTAAQLTAAYGVTDRLQLGANLPIIFALQGDGLMPQTGGPAPNGLNVTGLGDLVLEAKVRLVRDGRLRVAAIGGLSLPSSVGSGGSQFIGDDLPTVRGKLAAQLDTGRLSFGANAGVLVRKPRTIYDSTIGQQLTWGAAGAVRLTDRFSLAVEGYGRAGLPSFALDASPLEVEAGLRMYATSTVALLVGGGAGLVQGIGSPESRFFVSIGYAPDVRDSDGDGIPNGRDRCPLVAEDKDGFEDDDGCPDDDNDGDHRPDATDQCPNQAEDLDGFEDDDGCPELDNDKDGIPDLEDKCPLDPEDGKPPYPKDGCPADKHDSDGDGIPDAFDACPVEAEDQDGFEDGDGCPELDNDHDGVPDAQDQCPLCPEDKDGFEDGDGCPELDNDHDGIPDAQDRCPLEAETVNGVADDDGCPDSGGVELIKVDGDRLSVDRVPTLAGRKLSRGGEIIVDELALVMRGHAEVTRWLVAVGLPSASEARRVADAVAARLVTRGVPADRVEIISAAGAPKIGGLVRERAPIQLIPACPAGMAAVPRPEATTSRLPAAPAGAPVTTPTGPR